MASKREAYKEAIADLKAHIGRRSSDRMHKEPDGDEDAQGKEPNEDGFEIESAEECALCGNKHNPKDEC
jgi:hypothetical protein